MQKERYEGIDGLKAYAIIGIALMHVLSNGKYEIGGFAFNQLIPSFTNLVFLFMMVSGFGMCCGYYQKIVDQKISVEDFYKKRYIKIWPYFALLCALDFVISPSKESLFEVFANLTLCQGLLPQVNISVIGVSWTLAVIFVFYMLFPFFCFLIGNKKRAWGVAVAALMFNWLCSSYFSAGRGNIEDNVRIYQNVTLGRADVYKSEKDSPSEFKGFLLKEGACICAGAKLICKKGTLVIGKNAVVGANAVLLNSIGDNEIWGGVPARFIGMRKTSDNEM